MKKLQLAYSRKEKLEKLMANLENLKTENGITQEQYDSIKNNYKNLYAESVKAVDDIKVTLKSDLGKKQGELTNLNQELDNLNVRAKIGEMPAAEMQKSQERINSTIQTRQKEVATLEALINAESSSDVGGYVEVNIEAPKGIGSIVGGINLSGLTRGGGEAAGYFTPQPYLLSLILGVVLFICIFLPWASYSGFGYRASANGTDSGWGVLTLLMSLVCVGLSFVAPIKTRAMGMIGSGALGLIGVIAYWFRVSGSGITPGFGLIIAGLLTIGIVVIGAMQYRQSE